MRSLILRFFQKQSLEIPLLQLYYQPRSSGYNTLILKRSHKQHMHSNSGVLLYQPYFGCRLPGALVPRLSRQ